MRFVTRRFLAFAVSFVVLPASGASPVETPPQPGAVSQPEVGVVHITGTNVRLPVDDLMKGRRHFEGGAHTAWHLHPGGQLILVEAGIGFVQRSGEPMRILHAGESDFTPQELHTGMARRRAVR